MKQTRTYTACTIQIRAPLPTAAYRRRHRGRGRILADLATSPTRGPSTGLAPTVPLVLQSRLSPVPLSGASKQGAAGCRSKAPLAAPGPGGAWPQPKCPQHPQCQGCCSLTSIAASSPNRAPFGRPAGSRAPFAWVSQAGLTQPDVTWVPGRGALAGAVSGKSRHCAFASRLYMDSTCANHLRNAS